MANYFVANSGSDSNIGTSSTQPWKTINKINSITLSPGDAVYFNRGDIWNEKLVIKDSGGVNNMINWGAYSDTGVTTPPIISGFIPTLPAWSPAGNLASLTLSAAIAGLNIVTFKGANQPIGRFPSLRNTKHVCSTMTIGNSPVFITATIHEFVVNDIVTFSTTGTLPFGLVADAGYYVIASGLTSNSFQLAASPGGTSITSSESYYGTITITRSNFKKATSLSLINFTATSGQSVFTAADDISGLVAGVSTVRLSAAGVLPSGLSANTLYYIKSLTVSTNNFELSLTPGGPAIVPGNNGTAPYSLIAGITDSSLSSDFNGGQIVTRKQRWIYDRGTIWKNTSAGIINFNSDPKGNNYNPIAGYGYFIQNHVGCLNSLGDWCYNGVTKVLTMYFGGVNPSSCQIGVPNIDSNVSFLSGKGYHTITGINFEGANQFGINGGNGCSNIKILNCGFNNIGQDAINFDTPSNLTISGCTISNCNNNGITLFAPTNCTITGNIINDIHTIAGMGQSGDGNGMGISTTNQDPLQNFNNIISLNTILRCGYNAISFQGASYTIEKNYIDTFCVNKDDGGGIYTFNSTSAPFSYEGLSRTINKNIILNGVGYTDGIYDNTPKAHGIYADNGSREIVMSNNTISNCIASGILLHSSTNIDVENNTIYNCPNVHNTSYAGGLYILNSGQTSPSGDSSIITFNGNIIWTTFPNNYLVEVSNINQPTVLTLSGDKNYYQRPMGKDNFFFYRRIVSGSNLTQTITDLEGWKALYSVDAGSSEAEWPVPPVYAAGSVKSMFSPATQTFDDATSINLSTAAGKIRSLNAGSSTVSWQNSDPAGSPGSTLDGGTLIVTPTVNTADAFVIFNAVNPTESLVAGKQYLLKFSFFAAHNGVLAIYFQRQGTPAIILNATEFNYLRIKAGLRLENSIILQAPFDMIGGLLVFRILANTGPVSLDNINLSEAAVIPPDLSGVLFYINATISAQTYTLTRAYNDGKNGPHGAGALVLQPFESIILYPA